VRAVLLGIGYLTSRGCRRVVLEGHSFGGVWKIYPLSANPLDLFAH
jgi:hypothetical protein